MAINGWNFVMQVYYIPLFYQLVYEYSATKAGAMLLPITLVQTASSTLSGLVVHRVGRYRECILFGWVCWAVGLGLMSTLDASTGVGKQIGYSLLIGVGVGNTLQPQVSRRNYLQVRGHANTGLQSVDRHPSRRREARHGRCYVVPKVSLLILVRISGANDDELCEKSWVYPWARHLRNDHVG